MKSKETGAAGLAAAFLAGMVVATALGGATFFQLERKLCMIVDLQLFSQIPLAHEKG